MSWLGAWFSSSSVKKYYNMRKNKHFTLISLMLHVKADLGLAVLQFTNTKYE
jgi:hypothetical protein